MAHNGSRRGAAGLAIPLMIVSFILFAGFLYWLNVTAEPTQPPEVVETSGGVAGELGGTEVDVGALATGPDQFTGQLVRLSGVSVASGVGPEAFFIDVQPPVLVRMDTTLVARGMTVTAGETVTLVGTVIAMSDSIVSDWLASGAITEADRPLVEFASHFIQAENVQTSGG